MKKMVLDPVAKRLSFINGSRVVATTDGTLVCLLPTIHTFSDVEVTFPDFAKDQWYSYTGTVQYRTFTDDYIVSSTGDIWVTAMAQELDEVAETLMEVPAGADFIAARIRLSRTSAPSHNWVNTSLSVLPVQDQWMPLLGGGSLLMEAGMGMARALHLEAKAGDLVLSVQQSVGESALDDWVSWNNGVSASSGSERRVGQHYYVSAKGLPIHRPATSSSYRTYTDTASSLPFVNSIIGRHDKTGAQPASYTDATDYSSTYSVDLELQFGRRS